MKSTDEFKTVIENYIQNEASTDSNFKIKVESKNKNIDDCITYILNTVQKSGCNGFADDEIFGMAMHYYDEKTIDIGKKISTKVVVNHKTVNTPKTVVKTDSLPKAIINNKTQQVALF
jgi:hypothetical protein